jgi:ribonuclease M5
MKPNVTKRGIGVSLTYLLFYCHKGLTVVYEWGWCNLKYGFVVEGFNDENKLLEVLPNAHVVVTKGTRLDNRVRIDINNALNKCNDVFLITDPDEAGNILANMLLNEFPVLKRIFLDADECKCYRNRRFKIGLEHCTHEYLYSVLKAYLQE